MSEVPAADGSVAFTLKASRRGDIVTLPARVTRKLVGVLAQRAEGEWRERRLVRGQRVGCGGESGGDEVVVQL